MILSLSVIISKATCNNQEHYSTIESLRRIVLFNFTRRIAAGITSHKRTSSAAGNEIEPPPPKRQIEGLKSGLESINAVIKTTWAIREDWRGLGEDREHETTVALFESLDDANTKVRQEWEDWADGQNARGINYHNSLIKNLGDVEGVLEGEGCWYWSFNESEDERIGYETRRLGIKLSRSEPPRVWEQKTPDELLEDAKVEKKDGEQ